MELYRLARAADLVEAAKRPFRQAVEQAIGAFSELATRYRVPAFSDAVRELSSAAPDTPALRAWMYSIRQLDGIRGQEQLLPPSTSVSQLLIDGPSVSRLIELLGWQVIGAASDAGASISLTLPSAPPALLSVSDKGLLEIGEVWPTSGSWQFEIAEGDVRISGAGLKASSCAGDSHWHPNLRARGSGIDASVPCRDGVLMNRAFQDTPIVTSQAYARAWAPSVARAAETILHYSPTASVFTREFVRSVVPLVCGDAVVGSASREEALGLVFLPATSDHDQLVECLLHETMHQYLFRIEECADLFAEGTSTEEKFYSPWRSDPRPLRMALHGAFVFTAVADLYLRDDAASELGIDRNECERRAYFRAKQVEAALRIVTNHAKPTKVGNTVVEAITDDLAAIFSSSRPNRQQIYEIQSELKAHSDRYSGYAR